MLYPNKPKLNWQRVNQSPLAGQRRQVPANHCPKPGATRARGPRQLSGKGQAATAQRPGPRGGEGWDEASGHQSCRGGAGHQRAGTSHVQEHCRVLREERKTPTCLQQGEGESPRLEIQRSAQFAARPALKSSTSGLAQSPAGLREGEFEAQPPTGRPVGGGGPRHGHREPTLQVPRHGPRRSHTAPHAGKQTWCEETASTRPRPRLRQGCWDHETESSE